VDVREEIQVKDREMCETGNTSVVVYELKLVDQAAGQGQ
jgi:hypothetical protein